MQDSLSVKISADDRELTRSIANISRMLSTIDSSSEKVTRNMNRRFETMLARIVSAGLAYGTVGASGGGGIEKNLTRFFSDSISGLISGKRASGGTVSAGNAYIVGEKGPETFVPSSSGAIVPGVSAGGVTVNMVINTPDANSFRTSKGQIAADMALALRRSSRFL